MSLLRLLLRSLSHYRRAHLGTLLGAALAAAILTGALAVGDSVRFSLRQRALARIGGADLALTSPGRFFREALAGGLASDLRKPVAPLILLPAAATSSDGELRAAGVTALGVDERFFDISPDPSAPPLLGESGGGAGTVALSPALAVQLGVKVGEEIVLRVDKPSLLSRDAPLSTIEDATVALRLRVTAVASEAQFGEFGLSANQAPARNAFVPLGVLQRAVGMAGRVNALLVGGGADPARATSALWGRWTLADSSLTLRETPRFLELRTGRVFLDPPLGEAALRAQPGAQGVLTYFVNGLKLGLKETPYSTVAALDSPLTKGLADDELTINEWLAEDLGASVGDTLTLRYWVVGPQRRLEERFASFRVARVVPLAGEAADPSLMPEIPGLSDKKNCREWEPGVPVDLNRIRDRDQNYWSVHRGTPKAFVTLRAGQRLWSSRFGSLTAVRYARQDRASVEACIRQALSPASQGVFFQPLRERALAASGASTDFGGLFFGFSLFLLVAALLLSALLFGFSVERRRGEVGVLLALGFPPKAVRRLVLLEGGALALLGSLIGVGLATLYTRAVLAGLSSLWSGAVAGTPLRFRIEPTTLFLGALGSFLCGLLSLFFVARRQGEDPARRLLSAAPPRLTPTKKKSGWLWPALLLALACGASLFGISQAGEEAAGAAFGAGALALLGGLLLCRTALLRRTLSGSLPLRNAARRPGRSLAAISLLASGVFLVVAVGANQRDPRTETLRKTSGTGGFALYAESSLPIFEDLNTVGGQERYGLDEAVLRTTKITALRLREGDEASCLNLNKAQTPRLLGVAPEALAGRFGGDWRRLERTDPDGAIPVIGDTNTVIWLLQKKPGDTLSYTDDRGEVHRLRIAGVTANATFQGSLILAETHFVRLFPERSGYRVFLIDTPKEQVDSVRRELTRALEDTGLSAVPSGDRLAAFQVVENTYLSLFAALGGLGVLLGSVGLGVIVLRNVEERRSELALLQALGFERSRIERLLLREHGILLLLGLGIGLGAGLLAVLPALRHVPPPAVLPLVLLGIAASGLFWLWLAARTALRGPLLAALRTE